MKRFSKVSFDDIKTIQVDSGVLLKEFDVENPVFLPENVICATSGGINPVCAPEYYDFGEDVDNAKSAKETKRIRGWNVSISFTTFTTSLDLIRLALGAADISGKILSLRQRLQYAKDFKDIWWVGKRADDKLIAIRLIRSLSGSGFSLQTNKRGKGQISVTLKGHCSFSDKNKIPMEIYVIEESNEPVIPDVPVVPDTPTASLYLYGTPSETGNIGIRSGGSVTYYDGAVLPELPERDESVYPYACIFVNAALQHCLHFYPNDLVLEEDDGDGVDGVVTANGEDMTVIVYRRRKFASDSTGWGEASQSTLKFASGYSLIAPFWTNRDIRTQSGELYLAGADPIPVGEIVDYDGDIPIYEVIT